MGVQFPALHIKTKGGIMHYYEALAYLDKLYRILEREKKEYQDNPSFNGAKKIHSRTIEIIAIEKKFRISRETIKQESDEVKN